MISDPNTKLIEAFGIKVEKTGIAWPSVFIIRNGRIRWRGLAGNIQYEARPTWGAIRKALEDLDDR